MSCCLPTTLLTLTLVDAQVVAVTQLSAQGYQHALRSIALQRTSLVDGVRARSAADSSSRHQMLKLAVTQPVLAQAWLIGIASCSIFVSWCRYRVGPI